MNEDFEDDDDLDDIPSPSAGEDRKSRLRSSLQSKNADLDEGMMALPKNLDLLMDVPLDISVRLGSVRMQIRDLLKLNKGSLIELEKEADEPLEIYVNDRLLAYGEVVMIKEKLGIRITDIVSLSERLESLR
ncbi:MAG: flagellar motor switch protein FliN [Magnetococcales bacterium]|nr:flagellar motor switch protein FliN [Magnetococcales bacterium]